MRGGHGGHADADAGAVRQRTSKEGGKKSCRRKACLLSYCDGVPFSVDFRPVAVSVLSSMQPHRHTCLNQDWRSSDYVEAELKDATFCTVD